MEVKRIREIRERLSLSQERFARLLGVSLQTVRRWEKGLTTPLPAITFRLEELQRESGGSMPRLRSIPPQPAGRVGRMSANPGLGSLFKGIGSFVDLVSRLSEAGEREVSHSGEVKDSQGKLRGLYGFSIRMGLGENPVVQQFGNICETDSGPVVSDTREPLVELMDEGDRFLVIAELPGIQEEDIHLEIAGDLLTIEASTGDRKYQKELLLPSVAEPGSLQSSYRNGVLEVRLAKQND